MSAPELPPELAGHLDVLTDSSDAHAKARAATANASGNAHVAAVMGSALSRQLGDKAERSWDLAAFVKKHEAVAEFSQNWGLAQSKSLLKMVRTVVEGTLATLREETEKEYVEYVAEHFSRA